MQPAIVARGRSTGLNGRAWCKSWVFSVLKATYGFLRNARLRRLAHLPKIRARRKIPDVG
ncbi:hypothetical protein MPLA_1830190 [Mesorhizobium sp. ORS 3359]|nr:hypothetical protein MPLA_1830190 [Mesorhizobium sp. ORS 3359]